MSSCEDDQMENQLEFHSHSLSRLATCTTSSSTIDLDNFDDDGVKTMLSRLSIESFDADGELSDGDYSAAGQVEFEDDKMPAAAAGACYSLPVTPLQQRSLFGNFIKQYASENDNDQKARRNERRRRRKKRVLSRRANWEERETTKDDDSVVRKMEMNQFYGSSFSGESENGGGALKVITRPKGGKSSLCLDMEEVKACRELGFELEFDMATMPSRLNLSASTLDTSSGGGSSPISNWRISSPGDDPKDVKARLKVWAQAVALASTSPTNT